MEGQRTGMGKYLQWGLLHITEIPINEHGCNINRVLLFAERALVTNVGGGVLSTPRTSYISAKKGWKIN